MKKVIVIGGGAAGMFAALNAARENQVLLIEKNEKLGKKIYITGKGRCNLSNYCDINEFASNIVTNSKFALSSLYAFSPYQTFSFFEDNGLKLNVERGDRVFPLSNKASDVTKTLEKLLHVSGVKIMLNTVVEDVVVRDGYVKGVIVNGEEISCDSVIVCTGGVSYPATGSTGDGYKFAKSLGHTIVQPKSSLVGLELVGDEYKSMQGLSLKNVQITCYMNENVISTEFGEMLFTHFGISGPIVLTSSAKLNRYNGEKIKIILDLKPALSFEILDKRIIREIEANNGKTILSIIKSLVPSSMVEFIANRAHINKTKKCAELTKDDRHKLVFALKNLEFTLKKLRPIEEAIITSGGVKVKEINPKTLESKLVKGLFFAGEVLDVDCYTGGFNLQFAFSSGVLAGKNA